MSFDFEVQITNDDLALRDMVEKFAQTELKPLAREVDETAKFVSQQIPMLADMGLMGMNLPEQWGGAGISPVALYLAVEALAAGCGSTISMLTAHFLATDSILIGANDDLKGRYLPDAASGKKLGCFGLTEPRAGSNPADMRTRAEKTPEGYRLNGTKHFITNAGHADFIVVYCITDPEKAHKGISALVVDLNSDGISVGKPEDTMGLKGGHVFEVSFDNVLVPLENLVGEQGTGFKTAMKVLDNGRTEVAAMCTGIASAALNEASEWSKQRLIGGEPLSNYQGIQWQLADMATQLDAARLLGLRAATKRKVGVRFTKDASMAKVFCSEAAAKITDGALQIHGGYGYTREMPLERYVRDVRIMRIYEGSSEIQRNIIAGNLLAS